MKRRPSALRGFIGGAKWLGGYTITDERAFLREQQQRVFDFDWAKAAAISTAATMPVGSVAFEAKGPVPRRSALRRHPSPPNPSSARPNGGERPGGQFPALHPRGREAECRALS